MATEAPTASVRVYAGELVSAACALALLVLMFALQWFGVDSIPGGSSPAGGAAGAENAWNGMTGVRWAMLLVIVVALGAVVLHASQRTHGTRTNTGIAVALSGSALSVLLIWRVLIELPAANRVVDQKLGAVLGVLAAIGIALGGYQSINEERGRRSFRARRRRRGEAPLASRPLDSGRASG